MIISTWVYIEIFGNRTSAENDHMAPSCLIQPINHNFLHCMPSLSAPWWAMCIKICVCILMSQPLKEFRLAVTWDENPPRRTRASIISSHHRHGSPLHEVAGSEWKEEALWWSVWVRCYWMNTQVHYSLCAGGLCKAAPARGVNFKEARVWTPPKSEWMGIRARQISQPARIAFCRDFAGVWNRPRMHFVDVMRRACVFIQEKAEIALGWLPLAQSLRESDPDLAALRWQVSLTLRVKPECRRHITLIWYLFLFICHGSLISRRRFHSDPNSNRSQIFVIWCERWDAQKPPTRRFFRTKPLLYMVLSGVGVDSIFQPGFGYFFAQYPPGRTFQSQSQFPFKR